MTDEVFFRKVRTNKTLFSYRFVFAELIVRIKSFSSNENCSACFVSVSRKKQNQPRFSVVRIESNNLQEVMTVQ